MPTAEQAFKMYRPLVEQNEQAVPILVYATETQVYSIALTGDVPIAQQLAGALGEARRRFGRPRWLLFSDETYMQSVSGSPEVLRQVAESYQQGDAQRAMEAGEGDTSEAVAIYGADTGGAWLFIHRFIRTDGTVRWGEQVPAHAHDGNITRLLRQALTEKE